MGKILIGNYLKAVCGNDQSNTRGDDHIASALEKYRPETYYDLLPATGKQLLHIDGMDFDGNSSELSKPKLIENGKYLHYGLESALSGNSPGVYHRHALMTEFAKLFKSKVEVVPHPIRRKVSF